MSRVVPGGRLQAVAVTRPGAREGWRQSAACRGSGPNLFVPVGETGPAVEEIGAAKAVCCLCPVAGECLVYALATNQQAGVWGGATEDERIPLRRVWLASRRSLIEHPASWRLRAVPPAGDPGGAASDAAGPRSGDAKSHALAARLAGHAAGWQSPAGSEGDG